MIFETTIAVALMGSITPSFSPNPALESTPATTVINVDDDADVRATIERFHQALASGDSVTALSLLAPDVSILESGGFEDLAEYRSHHLPGDMRFAQAIARERGELHVTVVGDAAWATSSSVSQGEYNDREINSAGAELMVLTRTDSGWIIRAIHWSSRRISS